MKIIISWSGDRSKDIAAIFHWWLPLCIQSCEPWMSESDIPKGKRWALDLAQQLSGSNFGLVCITPENLNAPWLNFEAGALSKLPGAYLWTYLHDLKPTEVVGPLEDFQHTQFTKEEIIKLVQAINGASEKKLSEELLKETFEAMWPKLEEKLMHVPKRPSGPKAKRETEDMIEEILGLARDIQRSISPSPLMTRMFAEMLRGEKPTRDIIWGEGKTHVLLRHLLELEKERRPDSSTSASPSPSPKPTDEEED